MAAAREREFGVRRVLGGLLHGVAPLDPVTIGVSTAAVIAAAVVALIGPVLHATCIDPATIMK
ncbi:MAG TPA: hypothetical protein VK928_05805 [Longimicrobiales bacterium]|nr:hypothetical protein [Longimicrobiales bacterium]